MTSGPFTIEVLKPILRDVVKQGKGPRPEDLAVLARSLNGVHAAYVFATTTANKSKLAADKVRNALEVLIRFFNDRREACSRIEPYDGFNPTGEKVRNLHLRTLEKEQQLYDRFSELVNAMEHHEFNLDMDAGLLMPRMDCWRSLAGVIANAFRVAMAHNNPGRSFGRSNDGPVPRFVSAVVPMITEERPSVQNVAGELKGRKRKGPPRPRKYLPKETGTNG